MLTGHLEIFLVKSAFFGCQMIHFSRPDNAFFFRRRGPVVISGHNVWNKFHLFIPGNFSIFIISLSQIGKKAVRLRVTVVTKRATIHIIGCDSVKNTDSFLVGLIPENLIADQKYILLSLLPHHRFDPRNNFFIISG